MEGTISREVNLETNDYIVRLFFSSLFENAKIKDETRTTWVTFVISDPQIQVKCTLVPKTHVVFLLFYFIFYFFCETSSVKMVNQLLAGVHIASSAEAIAFGARLGIGTRKLFEILQHSRGYSWYISLFSCPLF